MPGLALTTEAFLLTIALRSGTSPTGRLLASAAGIAAIAASMQFLARQAFSFDLYEAVIEAERKRLGLHGLTRDALLELRPSFSPGSQLLARKWEQRWWLRKPVVELRAVTVWGFALAAFAAINVFVFGCAVAQLLGADISWF